MLLLKGTLLALLFCFSSCAGFWNSEQLMFSVNNVRQKFTSRTNKEIGFQLQIALEASYFYQAYASYFQRADVNLPGVQKFFIDASTEQRHHAEMLSEYVNKRGGHVQFHEINLMDTYNAVAYKNKTADHEYYIDVDLRQRMCVFSFVWSKNVAAACGAQPTWKNALFAFQDALAVERYVNSKLIDLHKIAERDHDAHLTRFLEHNIMEDQVEAINKLSHYVSRLRSFKEETYALGEYLFDQALSK